MITSTWNDRKLSRLMLGTVQFGMPYGVANRTGQPTYHEVVNIVAAAVEGGVNCFDTAAAYGTSEEVLGRVTHELRIADDVTIVTKILPLTPAELSDARLATEAIERSVETSRQRLGQDCLLVVLFHRESDAIHRNALEELQSKGLVRQVGVSCDNRPGPAARFVTGGKTSALQIPGNILDRRHQASGIFELASQNGVAIFVRSLFLQGLLLAPAETIPAGLRDVIPVRAELTRLAAAGGMCLAELALRYMLSQPGVTSVLTGVETVQQVQENLLMLQKGPLPQELVNAVDALRPDLSEFVLTPSQWNSASSAPVRRTSDFSRATTTGLE